MKGVFTTHAEIAGEAQTTSADLRRLIEGQRLQALTGVAIRNTADSLRDALVEAYGDVPSEILALINRQHELGVAVAESTLDTRDLTGTIEERAFRQYRAMETIARAACEDTLTGVYNRRYFDEALRDRIEDAKTSGAKLSLLMFDIDHFKKVNDTWGHHSGDLVLKTFAAQLKKGVKKGDIVARPGGEEFVILMSDATQEEVAHVAERLRETVAARPARGKGNNTVPSITTSIGVAHYRRGESPHAFIARADAALYAAKNNGRNRVVTAPPKTAPVPAAKPLGQ